MVRSDTTVVEGWLEESCWHGPVRVTEMKRFRGFRQQVGWGGFKKFHPKVRNHGEGPYY